MNDDALYTEKCKNGDAEAFGILYDRYIEKIYRFVFYKTFVKEIAEDITSDVFHKAYTKIASYNEAKGTFSAWIYRIARNAVIDHYRTAKKTVPIEDVFDIGVLDNTIESHDALLDFERVRVFMNTMTPRQREIITLRLWEEKSYKEIAEIIGGTEDAAKMAFSRAMRDLREKCGPLAVLFLIVSLVSASLPFDTIS